MKKIDKIEIRKKKTQYLQHLLYVKCNMTHQRHIEVVKYLIEHADEAHICTCKYDDICNALKVGRAAISEAMQMLIDAGLMKRVSNCVVWLNDDLFFSNTNKRIIITYSM